jgi:hypothetical protein
VASECQPYSFCPSLLLKYVRQKSLQRAYYVNKESEEMDVFKATINETSNRQQATVRRELVQRFSRSNVQRRIYLNTAFSFAGKSEALKSQNTVFWDETVDEVRT